MHRDTAMQCFLLKKHEVSKETRSHVKNKFVFPEFYGDWYQACCQNLWRAASKFNLCLEGTAFNVMDHLARKGITRLGECNPDKDPVKGTFEYLIKEVENDFWHKRFKVYTQWKRDWWDRYCDRGWFDLKTGFRCAGVFDKKQVCNTPIQGAAFHCLLWTLNTMDRWLRKNKMKSRIFGQIHDSICAYVHPSEKDDYIEKIRHVISVELPATWDWIIVPMVGEVKASDKNWFDIKEVA